MKKYITNTIDVLSFVYWIVTVLLLYYLVHRPLSFIRRMCEKVTDWIDNYSRL